MTEAVIIQVACSGRPEAERIAEALLAARQAACIHLAPHASFYLWQGRTETAEEWTLSIHTAESVTDAACATIRALHSYDLPAIFVLAARPDAPTAEWLSGCTKRQD